MKLYVICHNPGRVGTKMWTEGKCYPATCSGYRDGNLTVIDDLGHTRVMANRAFPHFPMGTDGQSYPNTGVYSARFERREYDRVPDHLRKQP